VQVNYKGQKLHINFLPSDHKMDLTPFQSFTFMAAPAVLCNASAVLALGASNRFARAVDRARNLATLLEKPGMLESDEGAIRLKQFHRTHARTRLLLHALSAFYISLGSLAAATVITLIGIAVAPLLGGGTQHVAPLLAVGCGAAGVAGLGIGCVFLVRETRLAVVSIAEEDSVIRSRLAQLEGRTGDGHVSG
jgi:hypothetical protein